MVGTILKKTGCVRLSGLRSIITSHFYSTAPKGSKFHHKGWPDIPDPEQYGIARHEHVADLPLGLRVQCAKAPMTTASDPREHMMEQAGLWYTVPTEEYQTMFSSMGCVSRQYVELKDAFREASFMIRRPAVSVINYIKQIKLDAVTPPKFIFYGEAGAGKTNSLAHVAHFLHKDGFLIVQVPWANYWLWSQKLSLQMEISPSLTVPNRWDHINAAAVWLKQFRTQNSVLLAGPELVINKDYKFSSREGCSAGDTLLSVVEMGIARPRLASDCALTITTELKQLAMQGRCKVALVMDGINTLFKGETGHKQFVNSVDTDKRRMQVREFTLLHAFLHLIENDWHNGLVVGTVDYKINVGDKEELRIKRDEEDPYNGLTELLYERQRRVARESCLPRFVMGEEGFQALDPFVAVPVPEYSDKEFESALNYYSSKRWLQHPNALRPEFRTELAVLTARNPYRLVKMTGPL